MSEPNKNDIQSLYLPNAELVKFDLKTGDGIDDICLFKELEKSVLVKDLDEQAALSVFNDFSKLIRGYEGETILFIWDPEYKMDADSNFYFCTTETRKEAAIADFDAKGLSGASAGLSEEELAQIAKEKEEQEKREAEEKRIAEAIAKLQEERVIRPWKDRGSYEEIKNKFSTKHRRPILKYHLNAKRQKVNKPVRFLDEPITHVEFKVKPKDLPAVPKKQSDGYCQTHEISTSSYSQTPWVKTSNKVCQYEAQFLEPKEVKQHLLSPEMRRFLKRVERRMAKALKLNHKVDCFLDEFRVFPKMENNTQNVEVDEVVELATFIDVEITSDKTVTGIQWCPSHDDLVAVSVADSMTFDERIAVSGKPRITSILFWKLGQVKLRSSLVLSVPQEIFCFQCNPENPQIVAAGLASGQVAVWDFQHIDLDFCFSDDMEDQERLILWPTYISSLDSSQPVPVTDLHWIPKERQQNKENIGDYSEQFLSVAGIEHIFLWDMNYIQEKKKKSKQQKSPLTCIIRMPLSNLPETPFPTKIALLDDCETLFGSEDGTFGLGNLYLQKHAPNAKPQNGEFLFSSHSHVLGIKTIQQSPHFQDLFLTVADWRFMLWWRGLKQPLFISPQSTAYVTCGTFCPTRPGIIVIGKMDGTIDIWDITESTHEPVLEKKAISIVGIKHLKFKDSSNSSEPGDNLRLAVGDDQGALRILKLPICASRIRKEKELLDAFYNQEKSMLIKQSGVEEEGEPVADGEEKSEKEPKEGEMGSVDLDEFNAAYVQIEKQLRRELGDLCVPDEAGESQV